MYVTTKNYGNLRCDVDADEIVNMFIGRLYVDGRHIGSIEGVTLCQVRRIFQKICEFLDCIPALPNGIDFSHMLQLWKPEITAS